MASVLALGRSSSAGVDQVLCSGIEGQRNWRLRKHRSSHVTSGNIWRVDSRGRIEKKQASTLVP
jgi:hypothetical protein